MAATHPNVFNIPASAPFLPVLIDALRAGQLVAGFPAGDDPLALARATLYLPTRRACRLAISTRTRSPSRKPPPANWPSRRCNCRIPSRRSSAGCCSPS
jgi:hypothetical protein